MSFDNNNCKHCIYHYIFQDMSASIDACRRVPLLPDAIRACDNSDTCTKKLTLEEVMELQEGKCRKASEVAREIIADFENSIDGLLKVYIEERAKECAIDTPLAEYISGKIDAYSSVKFRLAELKKKYTESEKDNGKV